MAKLSARGASVAAKAHFITDDGTTGIVALRSDGKVLTRITGEYGSGYRIFGSVRAGVDLNHDTLRRIAARRGWTITKEEGAR